MPALFTSTSMGPNFSTTALTSGPIASGSATFACTAKAFTRLFDLRNNLLCRCLAARVVHGNRRTARSKLFRNGCANPFRGASHQCHFAVEVLHDPLLLSNAIALTFR